MSEPLNGEIAHLEAYIEKAEEGYVRFPKPLAEGILDSLRELLSARTSTAPVATPLTADVSVLSAGNSDYLRLVIDPKHGERAEYRISIGAADVLFHELAAMSGCYGGDASPPPPQPGVRVTEEMVEKAARAEYRRVMWPSIMPEYRERELNTGWRFYEVEARRWLTAALTASIPDSKDGWQDIATAPKDRWVLGVIAGGYRPGEPYVPMSIRWHDGWGGFLDVTRWHAYESQDEDRAWEGMREPTHWRPLPTPPSP